SVEAELRNAIAQVLVRRGDPSDRAAQECEKAAAREGLPAAERGMMLADAATARLFGGDFTAARDAAGRALTLGEEAGSPTVIAQAHGTLAWVSSFAGDIETALDHVDRATAAFAAPDAINRNRDIPEVFRGMTLIDADRFDEAASTFRSG